MITTTSASAEHGALDARADALIAAMDDARRALVALRSKHELTIETVAERMGVSAASVAAFEAYDADPKQSTIQRYAMAVGARITFAVDVDEQPARTTAATLPLKTAQDEVEYRVRTAVSRVRSAAKHNEDYPREFVNDQIQDGERRLAALAAPGA